MKKLYNILLIFVLAAAVTGCNDEDNIDTIFASGTWSVSNFVSPKGVVYHKAEDVMAIKALTLSFNKDGKVYCTLTDGSRFEAKWMADGKKKTINFDNIHNEGSNIYDKDFIKTLREATKYEGDSRDLKILDETGHGILVHHPKTKE